MIRTEREWYSGHDGVGSGSMHTHMHTQLVEEELWCGCELVWNSFRRKKCLLFFILFLICFLLSDIRVCVQRDRGTRIHVDLV